MELENENTIQQEEQDVETDLSAFDDGWSDTSSEEDSFALDDGEKAEPAAETPAAEEVEPESRPEETESGAHAEADSAGEHEQKEGSQLYKLKHLNDEGMYTIDEVLEYAGKGLDYDFVRKERDELKRERAALNSQSEFLKEMARRSGDSSIEAQMDRIRALWKINDARDSGTTMSQDEALIRAKQERIGTDATADEPAGKDEPENKPDAENDAAVRAKMFSDFMAEYPDVKAEDIPKEVWNECAKTGDLSGAYRKHENAQLKAQLEELKRDQRNKERSTGSWRSAGASTPKDAFDEGWDSL